jgi:23S rRNA (cytidine1920-2'-O)/16S rRNA (cytidine1409-2'-O)-methyltransferase
MATTRRRLDQLLVERGLAADLREAGALILAGDVRVAGERVRLAGHAVTPDTVVSVAREPYVSRGGHKLAAALDGLGVDVTGLVALDAGASTGGFTDCLLQRGAVRVHAVDVGHGLLAWKVRSDARVVVHERTHVDRVTAATLGEPVDLVTADLSFISLRRVLPALAGVVRPGGRLLLMVKPQFEARRDEVPPGGVLVDPAVRARVVDEVAAAGHELGLVERGRLASPVAGADGNIEVFLLLEGAPCASPS